jgi:hypothetical protein
MCEDESHGEILGERELPPLKEWDIYSDIDHPEPDEFHRYRRKPWICTQEFLDVLHGKEAQIYFSINGRTWVNKPQPFDDACGKLKWLNDSQHDIYFLVNSGGTHDHEINRINAFFVDLDAGKDIGERYFPQAIVLCRKIEFWTQIIQCPKRPSLIVETRNGFHLYWLAQPGCTIPLFRQVEARLVEFFGSDPSVNKPAQVMRLPNYFWFKKNSGCDPFYVRMIEFNNLRYTPDDLLASLPEPLSLSGYHAHRPDRSLTNIDEEDQSTHNNYKSHIHMSRIIVGTFLRDYRYRPPVRPVEVDQDPEEEIQSTHNNYKTLIDNSSIIVGTSNPTDIPIPNISSSDDATNTPIEPAVHSSQSSRVTVGPFKKASALYLEGKDIVDTLKEQDLAEYLNVSSSGNFLCPFHNDIRPSASIYQSKTGHWMMKCHGKDCKFPGGTIIDVVMYERNVDKKEAIEYLKEHYGIKNDSNVWKKEAESFIEENINILSNMEQIKQLYPHLYRVIHRVQKDLLATLAIAQEKMVTDENGNMIFFCSLRELHRRKKRLDERPKYAEKQNQRIDRYCLLKLMEKLPDESIPRDFLERAQKEQSNRKVEYRCQFYRIPAYTPELLKEADDIAKGIKEKKLKLKGISRTSILQCFDQEVANRVYPLYQAKESSVPDSNFLLKLEEILIHAMKTQGYATYRSLYADMHVHYSWTTVTQDRIARYLPGLLTKHRLTEVQSNQELKAQYRIPDKGYPKIIVREDKPAAPDREESVYEKVAREAEWMRKNPDKLW